MKIHALLAALALSSSVLAAQDVFTPGDGVTLPTVVKQVRAQYTEAAMRARIEGDVILRAVVLADGKVGDVVVRESLDEGLDGEAVKAMKQYEFEPGQKDGKPVAVRIDVMMRFTLR